MNDNHEESLPLRGSIDYGDNDRGRRRRESIQITRETKYNLALPHLLQNPLLEDLPPVLYLKAAGECLFLTIIVSWIITGIMKPEAIANNPLKERLGYNNFCVGWDFAPANYVAAGCWILIAYLCLRFCFINHVRFTLLLQRQQRRLAGGDGGDSTTTTGSVVSWYDYAANYAYAASVCVFTLCLMIPPTQTVWGHTLPFIGFIVGRFVIVHALMMRSWNDEGGVTKGGKLFLWIYGIVSLVLPALYCFQYAYYDVYGHQPPFLPIFVTQSIDYLWFFCLAVTSKFLPSNIVIHRTFELVELP